MNVIQFPIERIVRIQSPPRVTQDNWPDHFRRREQWLAMKEARHG